MRDPRFTLARTPVHLGLGATAVELPPFTGELSWYDEYGEAHGHDGAEGRLVAHHTFDDDWDSWEVHPHGHELVVCLAGALRLHQEHPEGPVEVVLGPGEAVINPPGVWHTADVVDAPAQALFVTAGMGTQHRPR